MDFIYSQIRNKNFLILISFLFLFQLLLILFTGLELIQALVVSIFLLLSIAVFFEPFLGFFLLLVTTNFIEGKNLESFVLFKFFGFHWYLMDLVLLILFITISFRFISGEYKIKLSPLGYWLIIFITICFWGVYWGLILGNQRQDVLFDLRGFFYYLAFLPTILLLDDFKKIRVLFIFLLFIGTIKCSIDSFLSLYIYPKSFDIITFQYLPFARLKGYSEVVYPITLIASLTYFYFEKNNTKKIILIFPIIVSISALVLSYTRGSWFAAILTIMIGLFFLIKTKKLKIDFTVFFLPTIGLIILISSLFIFNIISFNLFIERATSVNLNKIDISNLGRLVEYATALSLFSLHPLLGAGLGVNFSYFSPGIGYISTIYTHNSYLYVLSKLGIIAIIPFLMLIYYPIKLSYKLCKNKILGNEETGIIFSFTLIFIFIAIKSLSTWHLNTFTFSLFIGFLFGIFIIYSNKLKKE